MNVYSVFFTLVSATIAIICFVIAFSSKRERTQLWALLIAAVATLAILFLSKGGIFYI